ncbi:hypothetical protein CBR_g19927 [Chara braunii]|uniref:BolA-like protein n=1 Tax=Chara braunii TaxID=69332 RepID=A0A388KZ22_CHABU|nr:hypothetical protein CBR_g19927 [Chara braunii]|eukprot:GBG75295.1 hypothetical protein CBR_g19927 [Chara braunii]
MAVSKEQVESVLKEKLQPTNLVVEDTSGGCGASFDVKIASPLFAGKRVLERHRMVNSALTEELKSIHALTIKPVTPEQWVE